jgi:hypothetical protein|eukprot:COSAG06_NODE_233_length_19608_cov_129.527244_10_plen_69_part_00
MYASIIICTYDIAASFIFLAACTCFQATDASLLSGGAHMQKRFQNSVSIFQKRRSDYTEYTPLYSWTP